MYMNLTEYNYNYITVYKLILFQGTIYKLSKDINYIYECKLSIMATALIVSQIFILDKKRSL